MASSGRFLTYDNAQICIALKLILVHKKILGKFRDAMAKYRKILTIGDGNELDVFLGQAQNSMQYEESRASCKILKGKDNVVVGGKNPRGPGYFYYSCHC